MTMVQLNLFPAPDPREALSCIERRLPNKEWLSITDVACAFDRSISTVHQWREAGRVLTMNSGAGKERGSYQIFRPSVITMAKVMLGIEEPQNKETT